MQIIKTIYNTCLKCTLPDTRTKERSGGNVHAYLKYEHKACIDGLLPEWNVEEVEPESAVRRLAEILSLSQIVELLEVVALREAPAAGGDKDGAGLRLRTGGLLVLKKS